MTTFPSRPDDKDGQAVHFVMTDSKDLQALPPYTPIKSPSVQSTVNSAIDHTALQKQIDYEVQQPIIEDIVEESP